MKKNNLKIIVLLHVLLLIYSLLGICSKLAAGEGFLSIKFCIYYLIVILNLGIYAICWQQIIKRLPLATAFANKAITVVWGILWGMLFFHEKITVNKIIGAFIIIVGIVLVVTDTEEKNG